jgi:hypothetical protein
MHDWQRDLMETHWREIVGICRCWSRIFSSRLGKKSKRKGDKIAKVRKTRKKISEIHVNQQWTALLSGWYPLVVGLFG